MSTPDPHPSDEHIQTTAKPEIEVQRIPSAARVPSQPHQVQKIEALFSGPLPHPSLLQGYENCVAGAADRILRMTESEGEHRRAMEKLMIVSDFAEAQRGQYCATGITLVSLAVSAFSFQLGHEIIGSLFGAGSIVAIIVALLKVKTFPHETSQQPELPNQAARKNRRKK